MKNNLNWVRGGNSKGEAGFWLYFDYDTEIIDQIKRTIPALLREWNPDKKTWWVSELCEKSINDIFKGFLEAIVAQKRLL